MQEGSLFSLVLGLYKTREQVLFESFNIKMFSSPPHNNNWYELWIRWLIYHVSSMTAWLHILILTIYPIDQHLYYYTNKKIQWHQ